MSNYTVRNNKNQELKNGILVKCTEKRKKNHKFSNYIKPFMSKNMNFIISDCGTFLEILGDWNLENKKLHRANFCKNRFCPMCSWRVSCKESLEISILMEHLKKEEAKEFIFLTLTTPNVIGDKLNEEIKKYNKAFEKLMKRKEVKQITNGYIRKLEVTYQKEQYITKNLYKKKKEYYDKKGLYIGDLEPNYNTYNPHFHIVIAVNKSYFTQTTQYINRDRWLELWRISTGDNNITQVDVRKAKSNNYKEVYELAKYSAKDSDYLINRNVFEVFYKALKGKQLIVYSGLFKVAHKMYQDHELDIYKHQSEIEYIYKIYYKWYLKEYEETKLIELTDEEKREINKKLINEMEIDYE